jgi:hypothetical protein
MNEFNGTHESLNNHSSSEERKSTTPAIPINKAEEMGVLTQEIEGGNNANETSGNNKQDFTEVFSWGSDRFG